VPQSIAKTGKNNLYMKFFESLITEVLHRPEFRETRASGKNNWRSFTSGTKGFTYAVAFPREQRIRAELYIDLGDRSENVARFEGFLKLESELHKEFGETLTWERLDGRRACRIAVYRYGKIEDTGLQAEYLQWAVHRLVQFKNVFDRRL